MPIGTKEQAIELLASAPVVLLDEESCRNVEDTEPMASVILDVRQRDLILAALRQTK